MKLPLDERFHIETDEHCFRLVETRETDPTHHWSKGDEPGTKEVVSGYYATLAQALDGYANRSLIRSGADTVLGVRAEVARLQGVISKALAVEGGDA